MKENMAVRVCIQYVKRLEQNHNVKIMVIPVISYKHAPQNLPHKP
jgi:hypothetical protein